MKAEILIYLEFLIRVIIAAMCGVLIGFERRKRGKGAGIRTHMVVALASSLMMIVSQNSGGDPTRIAAQVVSGIGFLGAGMIYFNRGAVNGLTTAAGIWATAGVGLAIGARLYFIGISTAVIMVLFQVVFHRNSFLLGFSTSEEQIRIVALNNEDVISVLQKKLTENSIHIETVSYKENDNETVEITMLASVPQHFDLNLILDMAKENKGIKEISIYEA